jgi:hypothetical protein
LEKRKIVNSIGQHLAHNLNRRGLAVRSGYVVQWPEAARLAQANCAAMPTPGAVTACAAREVLQVGRCELEWSVRSAPACGMRQGLTVEVWRQWGGGRAWRGGVPMTATMSGDRRLPLWLPAVRRKGEKGEVAANWRWSMGPMPTCQKGRVDGGGRLATMAGVGLVGWHSNSERGRGSDTGCGRRDWPMGLPVGVGPNGSERKPTEKQARPGKTKRI